MFLSVFDIFKIGIGPSSSHTVGPMLAATRFIEYLKECGISPSRLRASLHGSLAFTGKGHATDRAVILGLSGIAPVSYDANEAEALISRINLTGRINPVGLPEIKFDPSVDLIFDYVRKLPRHPNGLMFFALDDSDAIILEQTYYSVGGGFVVTESEFETVRHPPSADKNVPFPFRTASELVEIANGNKFNIADVMRANERALAIKADLDLGLRKLWNCMEKSIQRGLSTDGILPGGLNVKRRASTILRGLLAERGTNLSAPHKINDYISAYAMAVNEENAAGGQVVTAPTNGAAGVLPATIKYFLDHVPGAGAAQIPDFLLTSAAVGIIIKNNASISGAECGCQAEVGSASAMAAAGLCTALGGTPRQAENAAEIALEHHLGMTCDPIKGLVQVPCIERNGMGAIKAVSAASLSLRGDGSHVVSLDTCIETMRRTGIDMSEKYKETSQGGLAVSFPNC